MDKKDLKDEKLLYNVRETAGNEGWHDGVP